MKKTIIMYISLLICYCTSILGQWQKTLIEDNVAWAVSADVADMDGDTKKDLVVTNYIGGELILYQNDFPSWNKNVIDDIAATFAYTGDIDGNNTLDVVASAFDDRMIIWYENNYPTWTKHIIDQNTDNADFLLVGDLDNNDKPDVVTAGAYDWGGDVVWYENNHPNWIKHVIESGSDEYASIELADIDGDGFLDVIGTMNALNKVVWFRNGNSGAIWTKDTIDNNLQRAWGINSQYINGDDKIDLVATGRNVNDVIWYENNLPIWTKHVIDDSLADASWVDVTDVDGDEKMDVIACGFDANIIVWYENNHPKWTRKIIDSKLSGPRVFVHSDLDGDEFDDLIVPASKSVMWYKNPANAAYATSMFVSDIYLSPILDTLSIITQMHNPDNHFLNVYGIIRGIYHVTKDSIQLFDDGLHSDDNAGDNIWAEVMPLSLREDMYVTSISIDDITIGKKYLPPHQHHFTTKGPVVLEKLKFSSIDTIANPGNRMKFSLMFKNLGKTDTIYNVEIKLIINDSLITNTTTGKPTFGDIAPGEILTNTSRDFALSFKNGGDSCSIGLKEFGIEIFSEGKLYWYDSFTINVVEDPTFMNDELFDLPDKYSVDQNYPNPFNPITTIKYSIPNQGKVTLKVFDLLGSEVATLINKEQSQGNYELEFNGSELTSGIYFYRLQAGDFVETKKMILLK